jgi:hypothetical protein
MKNSAMHYATSNGTAALTISRGQTMIAVIDIARFSLICFSTLFLITVSSLNGQPSDWWWMSTTDQNLGTQQFVIGSDSTILVLGDDNLYRGKLFGVVSPVLDPVDFAYMESRPRFVRLPGGTVFAGGNAGSLSAFAWFRFDSLSADPVRLSLADLDSTSFNAGISTDDVKVLGNRVVAFRTTFSFDAGHTWYRMRNTGELDIDQKHMQLIGDSVYVLQTKTNRWYAVDTAQRIFTPSQLDGSFCRFAIMASGAGLAIRHGSGDEVELRFRRTGTDAWESLPELRDDAGTVVNVSRSLTGRSANLLLASPQRAVFFLDSGRVLEYDGNTFEVRTLLRDVPAGSISISAHAVGSDSVVRVVYQVDRTTPQKIRTYSAIDYTLPSGEFTVTDAGRYRPRDVTPFGILYDGPRFRETGASIIRAAVKAPVDADDPANQPVVRSVGMAGDDPFCLTAAGEIYAVTDPNAFPARLSVSAAAPGYDANSREVILRVTPIGVADGEVIVPGTFVTKGGTDIDRYASERVFSGSLTGTCAHLRDNGELFIGSYDIARKREDSWSMITIPRELRDSGVAVSSISTLAPSTMIVGLRGSSIGSSTTEQWIPRKGGVIISTDDGATWRSAPLPENEQWVETVTRGPDGQVYCWATTMVMDSAYGGGITTRPRHGSARVYRTSDLGETWRLVYVDEVDEIDRRAAALHQWSISFSSSGAIAINTPFEVLTAPRVGEAFTPVEDLPPNAAIGGVVFDAAGDLWIGTRFGVHRRSLIPTSVHEDEQTGSAPRAACTLHAMPNPAQEHVSISLVGATAHFPLPDHITLTSVDGAVTARIPRTGMTFEIPTTGMPAGVYTATATSGHTTISTMIVIL